MTDQPGFFTRNFKLTASGLTGLILIMMFFCFYGLVSKRGDADKSAGAEPLVDHHSGTESVETPAIPAIIGDPGAAAPAPHRTELESIRQMEDNAANLYKTLRQHSRENPDSDKSLSEQEIREMEKAGAVVM